MSEKQPEFPIFFDGSHRRWKRLKWWTAATFISLIVLISFGMYRVANLQAIQSVPDVSTDVSQLANELAGQNVPTIGAGPLVRVVKVAGDTAEEIYSGEAGRKLSRDELLTIGDYDYALERYGSTQSQKRIILTFDDGPDPRYTPQLLDLLSKESAPATFFVLGNNVVKYPDIMKRIVREGHGVANHSFTHADLEVTASALIEQELNLTTRAIRATTGYDSTLARPPYIGLGDQSLRNGIHGILHAQKLGMTVALYDFDTNDWQHHTSADTIPLPPFDGQDHVLLLHDGGGNRQMTVAYVERLISQAKKHGYTFAPMHTLYPSQKEYFQASASTVDDTIAVTTIQAATTWPLRLTWTLFFTTVIFVFIGLVLYVILAIIEMRRTRHFAVLEKSDFHPSVTVIIPAYNEEKVLKNCIKGLRASKYSNLKLLIVDDGSTDKTWKIARQLARKYDNVRAYRQENAGKAAAINFGIKRTWSPVIIGIDADTVFLPDTVGRLVRHFKDPKVGAVAGMVQVGNAHNILAHCQALEYSTSICLERTAQAYFNAIMVVPGACGAWRREAVKKAGQYSSRTLAEDCDITVSVHGAGYRIVQDNTAVSYTEVPTDLRSFARQRFRWAFGNAQVYWKSRELLLSSRRDWLNSFVLPLAIVSTVGPVIFLPWLGLIAIQNLLNGQYEVILLFMGISLLFQYLRAYVALKLGRQDMRQLLYVPLARILYGPLRLYLLYGTILKALRGDAVGWNKLARVGLDLGSNLRLRNART